jgi:thioredoxin-related protein
MKKENILIIALVCIAAGLFFVFTGSDYPDRAGAALDNDISRTADSKAGASGIIWQDYAQGLQLARKQNKPVFLYFHAQWCRYCKKLKKTTLKDQAVMDYLRDNFISISIDTDRNKDLANQWKVRGLPTLWFLKSDNSRITSIPGFVDEKQFLNVLKFIRTASYEKMSFRDFVKTL